MGSMKTIEEELRNKFETDERAAEIIVEIFDNEYEVEDLLAEDKFYFAINDNLETILKIFKIEDYKIEEYKGEQALVMFNIRDAATVYYAFIHINELLGEEKICSWCKKPVGIFKDKLSEKEYELCGTCQECQEKNWKVINEKTSLK